MIHYITVSYNVTYCIQSLPRFINNTDNKMYCIHYTVTQNDSDISRNKYNCTIIVHVYMK